MVKNYNNSRLIGGNRSYVLTCYTDDIELEGITPYAPPVGWGLSIFKHRGPGVGSLAARRLKFTVYLRKVQ